MTPITCDTILDALYDRLDMLQQRATSDDVRYARWPVHRGPNPARQRLAMEIRQTRNAIDEIENARRVSRWPAWMANPEHAAEAYAREGR